MNTPPSPLAEKALTRLRGVAEGNGVDPKKIELIGADERTLVVKAEMHFTPDIRREQKRYVGGFQGTAKKDAKIPVQPARTAQEMEAAIAQIKEDMTESEDWVKNAYEQLKTDAGQGWGLEDAEVTLDDMATVFYLTEMCPACQGRGNSPCDFCRGSGFTPCQRCNASGQELCYDCNGTGQSLASAQAGAPAYCLTCRGSTMAVCRICQGRRQVNCTQCVGKGNRVCQPCSGNGKMTIEEKIIPTAQCAFALVETADLPSGFRRAVSRGGLQMLARGHAHITMHDVNMAAPPRIFIPYTAEMPYADVRVRLIGKPVQITVLGHKGLMPDVPPFLDAVIEPKLAELEASPRQKDAMKKAFAWRILRDAFGLMQEGDDIKALRKRYPIGFSREMLERVWKLVIRMAQKNTIMARLIGGAFFLVAMGGLFWFVLAGGIRAQLVASFTLGGVLFFDILACCGAAFAGQALLKYIGLYQLRRLLGEKQAGRVTAQKMDGLDMCIMALAPLLYLGMIFLLNSVPNWLAFIAP